MPRTPFWQKAVVVAVVAWFLMLEPADRRAAAADAVSVAAHVVGRLVSAIDEWVRHWEPDKATTTTPSPRPDPDDRSEGRTSTNRYERTTT